jgi:signal transduction histidine kinase
MTKVGHSNNMKWRQSLSGKFTLLLATLLILQVLLTGTMVSIWLTDREMDTHEKELQESASIMLPALEDSLSYWVGAAPPISRMAEITHHMQRGLKDMESMGLIWIDVNANYAVAGFLDSKDCRDDLLKELRLSSKRKSDKQLTEEFGIPIVSRDTNLGLLVLAQNPAGGIWSSPGRWVLIRILLRFVLVSMLLAWFLARPILKRISKIHIALDELGQGKVDTRLGDTAQDEIGQLARGFDKMAERITLLGSQMTEIDAKRRRLYSEVSHELGAPLTSVIGNLETLNREKGDCAVTDNQRITTALNQAIRLNHLVSDLLDLSRLEEASLRIDRRHIDLTEVLENEIAAIELACLDKNIELTLRIEDGDYKIVGDAERLGQILRNILHNSIQQLQGWQPQDDFDRCITCTLFRTNENIVINFSDNGPGIEPEKLNRLFKRYSRLNSFGKGSGLGLVISQKLAELHNGKIIASSAGHGFGATFTLTLAIDAKLD